MSRSIRRGSQKQIAMTQWKTNTMLYLMLDDDICFDAIMSFIDDEKPGASRLAEFIEEVAGDFWYQCVQPELSLEDLDIIDWNFIRMQFADIWLGEVDDEG